MYKKKFNNSNNYKFQHIKENIYISKTLLKK